ncbi:hypothetical protein GCM10009744_43700 [Kribbella alba]|uniref:Uncharacterized protein n=1 Tax=Kribbella alba TaxID=190197 RepID=A0ABN2FHU9_9ACTN
MAGAEQVVLSEAVLSEVVLSEAARSAQRGRVPSLCTAQPFPGRVNDWAAHKVTTQGRFPTTRPSAPGPMPGCLTDSGLLGASRRNGRQPTGWRVAQKGCLVVDARCAGGERVV